MSSVLRAGHRRPVTISLTVAAITALAVVGTGSVQAQAGEAESVYIVQVTGAPVATNTATKPAAGQRLDARSAKAQTYRTKLSSDYRAILTSAGVPEDRKVYEYGITLNGFAARLTSAQVARIEKNPGVQRIWKNEVVKADTVSTPDFLGLSGPDGAWAKQFGSDARAGEGVIIGVIDTGFWPENPSFAPLPEPRPDQAVIAGKWHGTCDAGADPDIADRVTCNNKVIGARYFASAGVDSFAGEFKSPRDRNGHGSHTASTAGGNRGVNAVIAGIDMGIASGMAPAARIAVYKGLWHQADGTGSGNTADLVAAIDQAVADGVDVINYSISGSRQFIVGPDEQAFFNAAAAGVFVSASAGNTPGTSTVAHNSPWVTTVAASTHDRAYGKTVTLGNGASYTGVGVLPQAVPSAPLIDSVNAGLAGAPAGQPELCFLNTLDPAKVTGKIVLCRRGSNARVDKSAAVAQAGGIGMVLYNNPDADLVADFHSVPTVHVNSAAGLAIKAYIASTDSPTASLSVGFNPEVRAPAMAGFSSSGPALASADLLKPDITAPGVDVIAAYSPAAFAGSQFNQISGTSMAAPHVAGIAALLIQKNPGWSPMAVKSALMTAARPTDNTGGTIQRNGVNQSPLDFGSGHLRPGSAFNPGLVYNSGPLEWDQYTCGIGQLQLFQGGAEYCDAIGIIDPSDLNYPSITVGDLPTVQTVIRTVTNVTNRVGIYQAKVQAPAGFKVKVSPSRLAVPPGRSATFKVTIERTSAVVGQWSFGSLIWSDGRGHEVRSPIAARQWTVTAPAELVRSGSDSPFTYSVTSAYAGTLTAAANGLAEGTQTTLHLVGSERNFDDANPTTGPAVGAFDVTVPAGLKLARFATYDADYAAGTDLDLFVYRVGAGGALTLVGSSAGGTAEESFTFTAAGTYRVFLVQFALPAGQNELDVKHFHYLVPPTAGSLSVSPASQSVSVAGSANLTASWSGLTAGRRYLGVIQYGDGTNLFPSNLGGFTILTVSA